MTVATRRAAGALILLAAASTAPVHSRAHARHSAHRYRGPAVLIPPLELDQRPELARTSRGIPRSLPPSTTSTTRRPTSTTTSRPPAPAPAVRTSGRRYLGRFRVTCYGPPQFYAGKRTASGAPVGPGSIAASPAVVPRGTSIELVGVATGTVDDTGVTGHTLDLWRPSCAGWPNPTVDVYAL